MNKDDFRTCVLIFFLMIWITQIGSCMAITDTIDDFHPVNITVNKESEEWK